ncbi:helix-turn-helix domain-containing protein [Acidaminococcus sp.]|uniref:helix-turn-helix domain-containing protein n=1 Tax=Acidaminococcus sp. TaxID=1872103 RepID=UPI003AB7D7BB
MDKKHKLCRFIGAKIRYDRMLRAIEHNGFSQADLGNLAHLHTDTISRIERGTYHDSIPLSTLMDISDALGIDVAELMTLTETEKELIHWEKEYKG